ncbi:succinate dehydrogenase [Klebsiella pneumoniae]|nr:succinate dehydrogenase [Klebsiella pneumoniae]HBW7883498.1 succinate dehydrogenase [Klebsiella pneumoniae]
MFYIFETLFLYFFMVRQKVTALTNPPYGVTVMREWDRVKTFLFLKGIIGKKKIDVMD